MGNPRSRRERAGDVEGPASVATKSSDERGAMLRLRVSPGARRDEVVGFHGDALKVAVRAPPDRGRANEAVLDLLATHLGVPRTRISLERGAASRDKRVRIAGLDPAELLRRLGVDDAVSASSGARSRTGASPSG